MSFPFGWVQLTNLERLAVLVHRRFWGTPAHGPFRCSQRLWVKGGQPPLQSVDVVVEFGVRERSVDPPVALSGHSVVIVGAGDNLKCSCHSHQSRAAFDGPTSRNNADPKMITVLPVMS